jgi:hypothetical protein
MKSLCQEVVSFKNQLRLKNDSNIYLYYFINDTIYLYKFIHIFKEKNLVPYIYIFSNNISKNYQ